MNTCFIEIELEQVQLTEAREDSILFQYTEQARLSKRKFEHEDNQPHKKAKHEDPSDPKPCEVEAIREEFEDSEASVAFSEVEDSQDECECECDEVCESPLSRSLDIAYIPIPDENTLKQELEAISEKVTLPSLETSPLDVTSRMITEFNQKYHFHGGKMEGMNECGNFLLIMRLLKKLQLVKSSADTKAVTFKSETCFLLGLLSRNEFAREMILEAGGLDEILSLVKDPSCCLTSLRYCCYAIGNLVTSLSDDQTGNFYRYISEEGLIPFLFETVEKNLDNWQLAQQVFFAVGNIAFVGDFERPLLACNSANITLACLKRHADYVPMCTDAIFFLKNLAYGERGREVILQNDGVQATLHALWKNPQHTELVELSMNLFFDLSFSGAIDELTIDNEPTKFFLSLLKQHRSSLAPVKECVRTMDDAIRLMMIKEGLVEAFISVFTEHHENDSFCKQIEATFCRMSREKIPEYYHYSKERVPSLQEFAARAILEKRVRHVDPATNSSVLPEDLASFIAPAHYRRCLICSCAYLHHSCHAVCRASFPFTAPFTSLLTIPDPLPIYLSFCSEACARKARADDIHLLVSPTPSLLSAASPQPSGTAEISLSSLENSSLSLSSSASLTPPTPIYLSASSSDVHVSIKSRSTPDTNVRPKFFVAEEELPEHMRNFELLLKNMAPLDLHAQFRGNEHDEGAYALM